MGNTVNEKLTRYKVALTCFSSDTVFEHSRLSLIDRLPLYLSYHVYVTLARDRGRVRRKNIVLSLGTRGALYGL
jgi:hypothetical protein